MKYRNLVLRKTKDILFRSIVTGLSLLILIPLILILYYVLSKGIAVLNYDFFTQVAKPVGEVGGGIANAILGTLILLALAMITAVPPGIFTGIYLAENQHSKLAYTIRLCADVLQGIPAIVIGIIAYTWFVMPLRHFSALSGGLALGIMMLPVVIRSTEETVKLIPKSLKEAALALGSPYYKVILKVVLPSGLKGILTGVMLGIARVSGEAAPLLFTAFGNPFLSLNILKPIQSLPSLIYTYSSSPYEEWHMIAWGAAACLVVFIFILIFTTKVITHVHD